MEKTLITETARELKQVSTSTCNEYWSKSELLIAKINELMLNRADIEKLTGAGNLTMMKDNHANHVRFIASVLKNYNPSVLVETVLWVFRAYRSHGFTSNYWTAQLNTWINLLKEILTPECYHEVYPYYEWMLVNIPAFVKISDENLQTPNSLN